MKRLVLIGTSVVHTFKYLDLIQDYFDDILVITDKPKEGLKFRQEAFNFSLKNPLQIIAGISRLKSLINDFNPTVVHVHQANSCAFYAIKACKNNYPIIVTAWGSDILLTPQKGFLYKAMLKYILKNVKYFTSDSSSMAEVMWEYSAPAKPEILIANFGIDIEVKDLPKEKIVYSNRQLTPLYRIDSIVTIFDKFYQSNNDGKNWKLIIAATGSEETALKNRVSKLSCKGNVEFVGWVNKDENSELYAKSSIYISIPESDATSISLLEAMAAGCFPIVSNLPANKEWINDRENGIIVNDMSKDVIGEAIQLLSDEIINKNKEIIALHGTKKANRDKFISFYNKAINES
ncbi:MAG TPA: glycosyltransferase family 4 protein [Bacteroidia bacterium]|nr:glycosyltransferase family 4 protein [Bacteroidia bacterium]HQF28495.1 glycosyltransferase family 4 protein [Bacteroidia bacterium]HQK97439.1 glycosyltransferase family 4 protein [Bacteroidia bacterium]